MQREEAIDFITNYVSDDFVVSFPFSFPFHSIPQKVKQNEFYESELESKEEILTDNLMYIIRKEVKEVMIIDKSNTCVSFVDEIHDYIDDIQKLNIAQIEFDKEPMEEKDNITLFKQINTIKNYESKLIERAMYLKAVFNILETHLKDFEKEIENINCWDDE